MINRLAAAMFIAMLTPSMAAVNSSGARSSETPRVQCMARHASTSIITGGELPSM